MYNTVKFKWNNNFNKYLNVVVKKIMANIQSCALPNLEICNNSKFHIEPPKHVRGMTCLDRSLFDVQITIPCLHTKDNKISHLLPVMKKYILKLYHFKAIQKVDSKTMIMLNPATVKLWSDLASDDRKHLETFELDEDCFELREHVVGYDNFTAYEILKSVLPESEESLSSFTTTGHIVHVNLREHLLPYKTIIGQVLLDKIPTCRTVVNKTDMIDNTYRNFKMEVLSGDEDFLVEVKENKFRFKFDYSTVYWNSRLCTEHQRVVDLLKSGDVLFDIFAGVGPFAVPAAKKKCFVYANDLNPESYKWLNYNLKLNKVDEKFLKTFNMDGRDFITTELKTQLLNYINANRNVHITMNLPAMAVEFLGAFIGLYNEQELTDVSNPPIVHVYCFTKGEDCVSLAKSLLFQNIGSDISDKIIEIFNVRTVSSLKEMMRISFKLDRDILVSGNVCDRKRKFNEVD